MNNSIYSNNSEMLNLVQYIIDTGFSLDQTDITTNAYDLYKLEDHSDSYEVKQHKIARVKFNMIKRVFEGSIKSIDDCERYYIYDYRVLYNYCLKDEAI